MSRRSRTEGEFGSDSFLDIVCNVVGILIILMVVAGVRASRTPVILPDLAVEMLPVASPAPAVPEDPPLPVLIAEEIDEPAETPIVAAQEEPQTAPQPLPPLAAPTELISRADRLAQDLASLESSAKRADEQLTMARSQEEQLRSRLNQLERQQRDQVQQFQTTQAQRAATQQELDQLRRVLQELANAVKAQSALAPAAKKLEHRITPIGQTVTGEELHFRIHNNRVYVIPLETLIGRVKNQIDRHKEWIARSRQQLGQVGPIDGFTMHYVVERDSGSLVDELRMGPGVFRIVVSEWKIEVESSAPSESVAEALRPGSRFLSAVHSASPGSALTFWVYPESFGAFTELKAYCQQQNFLIAGRPLPAGIPIAGSPTGTKSTGQ